MRSYARAAAAALALLALTITCVACGAASAKGDAGAERSARPNAPFAAGSSAANVQLGPDGCQNADCARRKRVMVRWVARHTGTIETLYLEFKSNISQPINCVSEANGYGGGTSGTALVQTYRVRPSGTPDYGHLLATTTFNPCKVADGGSVGIPLGFKTTRGREFATVVRNVDPHPLSNYFSLNMLYDASGIAGANGRNTRSPDAADAFYGLDPRELAVISHSGGRSWRFSHIEYLPTYVQRYADGLRSGQPYLYATCPCPGAVSGEATMVFPRVPRLWTIRQLGAYTIGPGQARVDLRVDGKIERSAVLSGVGMLRADIEPITIEPGSTVSVRTTAGDGGLALQRVDADTTWKQGPVLRLGRHSHFFYLERQGGGAADAAVVTVYPLPMYSMGGS